MKYGRITAMSLVLILVELGGMEIGYLRKKMQEHVVNDVTYSTAWSLYFSRTLLARTLITFLRFFKEFLCKKTHSLSLRDTCNFKYKYCTHEKHFSRRCCTDEQTLY